MRRLAVAISALLATSAALAAPTSIPDNALRTAAQLREQALADSTGFAVVESLTTEVGPRIAGGEADPRAVAWAKAKFKSLGFDKVWTEPVTFPKWERRSEQAAVIGAHAQPLHITALGGSPGGTVEGEIVRFENLAALQAAPAGSWPARLPLSTTRWSRRATARTTATAAQCAARALPKQSAKAPSAL